MANRERALVRDLARQVKDIAHEPRMDAIHKRWCDVNALRKPDRAPVYCRPVGCWGEILPEDVLECDDPYCRNWEMRFRKILHKRDIGDDDPVDRHFDVSARIDVKPENTWGVDVGRHASTAKGGAWGYDPPLKSEVDFDRLRIPDFALNAPQTREDQARAEDLLGDIMPVKVCADVPLSSVMGTAAADLRGLEQMMMDMIAEPELMHRLMAHLRDSVLRGMDQVEAAGILTPNNSGPMTCSDPVGEMDNGTCGVKNLWCMTNSQEFDQVSPAMWESFCLEYQRPILERFGWVSYGCCENLTHKVDGILRIPNLRIFVCSAWTDLGVVLEKVEKNHCIMWRQKASDVVFPDTEEKIRADLMEGARRLQGSYYQVVLRELETLSGHPDRLHAWTRCAIEAAERFA